MVGSRARVTLNLDRRPSAETPLAGARRGRDRLGARKRSSETNRHGELCRCYRNRVTMALGDWPEMIGSRRSAVRMAFGHLRSAFGARQRSGKRRAKRAEAGRRRSAIRVGRRGGRRRLFRRRKVAVGNRQVGDWRSPMGEGRQGPGRSTARCRHVSPEEDMQAIVREMLNGFGTISISVGVHRQPRLQPAISRL